MEDKIGKSAEEFRPGDSHGSLNVLRVANTGGGLNVSWGATHRGNLCEKCHVHFEDVPTGEMDDLGPVLVRQCPICGGTTGELISRQMSIEPPAAPACLRLGCLLKYLRNSVFYALVATYHVRRVAYAEANRGEMILERYRTGEPALQTIWQAIHANIKIRCPVCRKYNADPLLFRR